MNPELEKALDDYVELFGVEPPIPFGVSDERLASVLRDAVSSGEPVPDDFDWWDDLPEGADA